VEADARDEVLKHGGTLSHHHGVGKVRRRWMHEVTGDTGMAMLRALKEKLDPQNIFCAHNLGL
jgi:alkyldihydroxyacetonephosphate synthase